MLGLTADSCSAMALPWHYSFEAALPLVSMTTWALVSCMRSNIGTITVSAFTTFVHSFQCLSSTPLAVGCSEQGGAHAWTPLAAR